MKERKAAERKGRKGTDGEGRGKKERRLGK